MCLHLLIFCFFFKQKTAYEMRISDWSSDVCSSDLQALQREWATAKQRRAEERARSEAEAAKDAAEMWAAAGPARADHAYLVKKGISPHHFRQSADKEIGRAACRERVCQYV